CVCSYVVLLLPTAKHRKTLQVAKIKYLRKVTGKTRRDRVRNTTMKMRVGVLPLEEMIKNRQLMWNDNLNRSNEFRYPKRVFEARPVAT
ncbi:hypothetical protein ILUMI_09652, partial [Ignelater luminosus]